MKWALVVYFMTTAGWQSAESIGKDKIGWSSIVYESYQECSSRARMFNEDPEFKNKIKAKCERVEEIICGITLTSFRQPIKLKQCIKKP